MKAVLAILALFGLAAASDIQPALAEERVEKLIAQRYDMCPNALGTKLLPCAILVKEGETECQAVYYMIFSEDGREMLELVRHDKRTGKQEIIWQKSPEFKAE